jgi:hypothetical protein
MKRQVIVAAVVAAAAVGWVAWPSIARQTGMVGASSGATSSRAGGADAGAGAGGRQWFEAVPERDAQLQRVPLTPVDSSGSAWLSMADARAHGDARTPPLQRDEARTPPTAAELADPRAYQQYQQGQQVRVLGAFVGAAQTELPRLQADVERGRAAGVPAAQIAKLEEKIRRIEQQRSLILREHPELAGKAP